MNVMLSHFYLNSGNEEDLQNFRYIIESAYTTYAIHQATDNDLAAIREKLELFREKLRNGTHGGGGRYPVPRADLAGNA